jgi:amino acid permease
MVISYRAREISLKVARYKALRAMNISFGILFVVVFFYAISFTLAMGHETAERAYQQNISALAIAAEEFKPGIAVILGVVLNLFALVTAFFGVYLGFEEACRGIAINVLTRFLPAGRISRSWINRGLRVFLIVLAWFVVSRNIPVLNFTSISSPIFGFIGCLIPAWLVLRVPSLASYRNPALLIIIITGILLVISPLLNFSHPR